MLAHPDAERRFHPGPVPLLGGVAVYFALVAGLIAALLLDRFRHAELARLCWALIPAAALACLFGAVDDCCNLRSRAKLVLQFVAALLIASAGFSVDFIIVFGCRIELGCWGVPLTIFWLMGCINALNLIDGLDGLASVVGLSTTSMMGIIALNMGNDHVAAAALALTAALAGFLVFNRPPASIFLGDSGSTLIGLVIGVLGMQGSLKSSATLSITAPVVLMTLPMFDVVMAVVRRKLTGRPLALGDREHIHHCLLDRGLGPWQVLGILGALCLTTGAAATAATVFRMDALAWIIATTLMVLMIRLRVFGHREFGLIGQFVRRQAANLAQSIFLPRPSRHRIRFARFRRRGDSRREIRSEGDSPVAPSKGRPRNVSGTLRADRSATAHGVCRIIGKEPRHAPSPHENAPGSRVPRAPAASRPTFAARAALPRDLDVGVIYTGERDLMGPLLSTMKASAAGLDYRLLLVDNPSPDGIEPWRQIIPETTVLGNSERLNYAANMNRILAASTARYVLVMNTDMFFDPRQHCLARMVDFMDAHPGCGIAGCRLLHADGRDARAARRFQTLSVVLARRFGLGRLMQRTLDRYFYLDHAPGESFDCQWLSGCFLMFRNAGGGAGRAVRREFRQVFRRRGHLPADGPGRLAGDVSRGHQRLSHRAARQPQAVLGRRLAASPGVSLLAAQMGLSGDGRMPAQRACAVGESGVKPVGWHWPAQKRSTWPAAAYSEFVPVWATVFPTDPVLVEVVTEQLRRDTDKKSAPHRPRVGGSHD